MFTRFNTDFAEISASDPIKDAVLSLSADTLVECARGWITVDTLRPTDTLASLDGGFVPLSWIRRTGPGSAMFIPGGALGNCSDVHLPFEARIGYNAPLSFTEATTDILSVPLRAFDGIRGIRTVPTDAPTCFMIGLSSEEMIWAQTGLLVHAKPLTQPYFHVLSVEQTRALLASDPANTSTERGQ